MTTEYEKEVLKLLHRMADNYPAREDVRFFTGDADIAPLGSSLTVTFTLRTDFEIWVTEMYADVRADCTYEWRYSNILHPFNEVAFPFGKRIMGVGVDQIQLYVANAGASNQTIGYFIKGWARLKLSAGGA